MAEAMIQPQDDDSDFEDAINPDSDISGDDSGMETDENDALDDGDGGNRAPWVCVPIDEHYQMPFPPENFIQDPLPVHRPTVHANAIEYFDYFTTDEDNNRNLIDILVTETNRYAQQQIQEPIPSHSRMNDWVPTDRTEMRAFLGVMLAMGLIKKPTIESYWNKQGNNFLSHSPGFSEVFSRNRFQNILRFLHCNDNTQAAPRGSPNYDAGFKIRPIFDILNHTFHTKYNLARDLTVDESMVGFKGRTNLVQYMPGKKSHRWGAKLFVLAESDTGFTSQVMLYAGKFILRICKTIMKTLIV